jgi:hypothetical protein
MQWIGEAASWVAGEDHDAAGVLTGDAQEASGWMTSNQRPSGDGVASLGVRLLMFGKLVDGCVLNVQYRSRECAGLFHFCTM